MLAGWIVGTLLSPCFFFCFAESSVKFISIFGEQTHLVRAAFAFVENNTILLRTSHRRHTDSFHSRCSGFRGISKTRILLPISYQCSVRRKVDFGTVFHTNIHSQFAGNGSLKFNDTKIAKACRKNPPEFQCKQTRYK